MAAKLPQATRYVADAYCPKEILIEFVMNHLLLDKECIFLCTCVISEAMRQNCMWRLITDCTVIRLIEDTPFSGSIFETSEKLEAKLRVRLVLETFLETLT